MLEELDIRAFAIIDHLQTRFERGLTVLTGETGAGKSILIDALGIVLGGRASGEVVRDGETQARVEAIFDAPADWPGEATRDEFGLDDEGTIILAREVSRNGRSTARVNGRALPVSAVQQVGERLVDIHGQTEHLALMRAADQREMLDRYAGLLMQRDELGAMIRQLRKLRAEIAVLSSDERTAAQRLDLLRFQVDEINRASLVAGEEETLAAEARVLGNAERLRALASQLHGALAGSDMDVVAVEDGLGAAVRLAEDLARIDPQQEQLATRLGVLLAEIQEIGREMRRYAEAVEDDPQRLAAVLERQELLRALRRKYGATIDEILAFRDAAGAEALAISRRDDRRQELEAEEGRLVTAAAQAAGTLSRARHLAADRLAAKVQEELKSLHMGGATFQIRLSRQPDAHGLPVPVVDAIPAPLGPTTAPESTLAKPTSATFACDQSGVDQVEFLVAPNLGEAPKPVAKIASGGETSRIMLALKSALAEADRTATLVFDEVDVGIGGRSGGIIGEKLWTLARHHQVLCITHLPQVAVFGDQHLVIKKAVKDLRTVTTIHTLGDDDRLEELAQMLGGVAVTAATRLAAQELLAKAEQWKAARTR